MISLNASLPFWSCRGIQVCAVRAYIPTLSKRAESKQGSRLKGSAHEPLRILRTAVSDEVVRYIDQMHRHGGSATRGTIWGTAPYRSLAALFGTDGAPRLRNYRPIVSLDRHLCLAILSVIYQHLLMSRDGWSGSRFSLSQNRFWGDSDGEVISQESIRCKRER